MGYICQGCTCRNYRCTYTQVYISPTCISPIHKSPVYVCVIYRSNALEFPINDAIKEESEHEKMPSFFIILTVDRCLCSAFI